MEQFDPPSPYVSSVEEVLITEELARRPTRPPDHQALNRAMTELSAELQTNRTGMLQLLVRLAMELCHADSAGISILEPSQGHELFRWHAIAGSFAPNLHGTIQRDASPCGTVISRNKVLLFREPDRYYAELRGYEPRTYEALLVPWHTEGLATGTLWVLSNDPECRFDGEDARIVQSLAGFASPAYQLIVALEAAKASQSDLEDRVAESAFFLAEVLKSLRTDIEARGLAERQYEMPKGFREPIRLVPKRAASC